MFISSLTSKRCVQCSNFLILNASDYSLQLLLHSSLNLNSQCSSITSFVTCLCSSTECSVLTTYRNSAFALHSVSQVPHFIKACLPCATALRRCIMPILNLQCSLFGVHGHMQQPSLPAALRLVPAQGSYGAAAQQFFLTT